MIALAVYVFAVPWLAAAFVFQCSHIFVMMFLMKLDFDPFTLEKNR